MFLIISYQILQRQIFFGSEGKKLFKEHIEWSKTTAMVFLLDESSGLWHWVTVKEKSKSFKENKPEEIALFYKLCSVTIGKWVRRILNSYYILILDIG